MEKTYSLTAHYDEFQEIKYGGRYSSDILSNGMTLHLGGSLDRHMGRSRGGTWSGGRNKDPGSTGNSGGLPRWSRREICLLSALVFAAGMCVILGSMLALKYISLDVHQDMQCRQDCQRKRSLLRAARFVQANIDPTIQPCQDFYSFACGGWLRRHGIPEDKLSYGIITAIGEHNEEKLQRLLLEPIRRRGPNSAERKVKEFYRSCINIQEIDKLGSDPMMEVIDSCGGWDLVGAPPGAAGWEREGAPQRPDFNELLYRTQGEYSTAVFFSLTVNVDDKNSSRNAIRVRTYEKTQSIWKCLLCEFLMVLKKCGVFSKYSATMAQKVQWKSKLELNLPLYRHIIIISAVETGQSHIKLFIYKKKTLME